MSISGKRIVIDPGHGGDYPGATYGSTEEKDITLAVANKVYNKLDALGAKALRTRTSDTDFGGSDPSNDINQRVVYINRYFNPYDALVSLHINSATGMLGCHYYGDAGSSEVSRSRHLAGSISNEMGGYSTHDSNLAILRDTTEDTSKTLVEMEQIDNSSIDESWWQDQMADKIVNGLQKHFLYY